jgi:hypothetical protein
MMSVKDKVEQTIEKFICEFIEHPYLCYTEHGQHARFYHMLYEALDPGERYITWPNTMGQKVCVIQKEYPTAGKVGKPRRQNWDIAIIKRPPESDPPPGKPYKNKKPQKMPSYDYLRLEAIIEFGMNEAEEHLREDIDRVCYDEAKDSRQDDIERACDPEANADHKYIVHLYRLSEAGNQFSMRDWSPSSTRILPAAKVKSMIHGKPVTIFYGMYDKTNSGNNGAWLIKDGAEPIKLTCK